MTLDPEAIQASWERIRPHGDMVPLRFYETLLMVHPELEPLFPRRMTRQRDHLFMAVDTIARSLKSITTMIPVIEKLGRRHAAFAEPEHYTWVGNALIATLENFDHMWTKFLLDQWTEAYDSIADLMIEAGSRLRVDIDPTPRWYTVETKERQRNWIIMQLAAYPKPIDTGTRYVWATPDGVPGLWRQFGLCEGSAHPDDLRTRHAIVLYFAVEDVATRAMAARPLGSRVAVAPMEDTDHDH